MIFRAATKKTKNVLTKWRNLSWNQLRLLSRQTDPCLLFKNFDSLNFDIIYSHFILINEYVNMAHSGSSK